MKIFRFDDVCINADMKLINDMTNFLFRRFPDCKVLWGVSPLVNDMSNEKNDISKQRIFPKINNAHSDYRIFYKVDMAGIPELHKRATMASHGLVHVDHRLLTKEAQELSILTSASLVNAKVFIPPFNKWNKDTESICRDNGIELIKFEDGWLCMEYNDYSESHNKWYLHAREFTYDKFMSWFTTWGGSGIEKCLFDFILNKIEPNSTVIEIGSGYSSTKAFSEHYQLYSIDNDPRYIGVFENVNYIHAPIVNGWYNREILKSKLPTNASLVFVDGPMGEGNRYEIINNLDLFNENCVYIFHDTYRESEKNLALEVAEKLNKKVTFYDSGDFWAVVE